jgi:hypothetical protein
MGTIESHYLTNGRPRRPCPPETRAYVDRLAREQGIRNWGRERRPVVIREPDEQAEAFWQYILDECTAEP